ncbi:IclR family transcriptional regulator [Shumkonia mesophila]|uniref:IclR family transcriptional regulator n=1 Tax=Shumkonia mesophila TaxID=2838854 RepID=UPI002934F493|nr:IclR family transcriptional regulator C-terminal domain-containing protein [Shumkonia mesophila]
MAAPSAVRILELIEWLATQSTPATLAHTCQALDLPKSSTLLLFNALVEGGYAERGSDGRYRLVRLPGEPTGERRAWGTLLRVAEPHLRRAVAEARESGFVAVLTDGLCIRYLNKLLPDREIRYDRDITNDRTAHHVASGLAILSALPEEQFERYLSTLDASATGADHPDQVRARVAKVRADGFAINLKGRVDGASGVAAPILDADRRAIGAINLSGPTDRVVGNVDAVARVAKRTAAQVSEEMARRATAVRKPAKP